MTAKQFDELGYSIEVTLLRGLFDRQYMPTLNAFASIASAEISIEEQDEFSFIEWPEHSPDDGRESKYRYMTQGLAMGELAFRFGTYLPLCEEGGPNKGRWNFGVVRRHLSIQILPLQHAFNVSSFAFEDRGGLGDADRHALAYVTGAIPLGDEMLMTEAAFGKLLSHMWNYATAAKREELKSTRGDDWRFSVPLIVT